MPVPPGARSETLGGKSVGDPTAGIVPAPTDWAHAHAGVLAVAILAGLVLIGVLLYWRDRTWEREYADRDDGRLVVLGDDAASTVDEST